MYVRVFELEIADPVTTFLGKSGSFGLPYCIFEPRCEKKRSLGFPTRSHTNQAAQPQKMAGCLKFRN